jgi:Arc/MetJ-type ribon-helix-helix transcriptional regulator
MTVKLSISVPDEVAAYLQSQGNVSSAVTAAVRRVLPEERRARQRAAAQSYGEYLRGRAAQPHDVDVTAIEASNDLALRGSEW